MVRYGAHVVRLPAVAEALAQEREWRIMSAGSGSPPVRSTWGSNGNTVRNDPDWGSNAAAAPATVSGEPARICHRKREGAVLGDDPQARRPARAANARPPSEGWQGGIVAALTS